ncbi:MAG: hypothetical protein MPJ06_09090 [Nitrosopumilus sp.]|nr:hypothetical protein [Nitrosopumilus sp.]MDA7944134.1 hypothetical protein [Nitrosopumilus sp.]MDA7999522.1 hypothetical protein [Nitrosopumilus sp.]
MSAGDSGADDDVNKSLGGIPRLGNRSKRTVDVEAAQQIFRKDLDDLRDATKKLLSILPNNKKEVVFTYVVLTIYRNIGIRVCHGAARM